MRKSLEALSIFGLALIFAMTWLAFNGPNPLPDLVPTHFDAAGNANAWGPPSTLWILPVVGIVLYLFVTVISLLPTGIRSSTRLTEEGRARLESLIHQMVAWIKLELVCLFLWIQWSLLQTVRQGSGKMSPVAVLLFLIAIFATLGLHSGSIIRATRMGRDA
ncbi:MAG: DUF1648 domain-containing protein [Terracidiphilus sp.]|jgi:uncharacterized membrane protein